MQRNLGIRLKKLLIKTTVVVLTAGNLIVIGNGSSTYATGNFETKIEEITSSDVDYWTYFKSEGEESHSLEYVAESEPAEEQTRTNSNIVEQNLGNDIDKIFMKLYSKNEGQMRLEGSEITYDINIYGYFSADDEEAAEAINNVAVKDILPDGVSFKSAAIKCRNLSEGSEKEIENVSYDEASRIVTWDIMDVERNCIYNLLLVVTVDSLPDGVYEKEIRNSVKLICGEDERTSNEIVSTTKRGFLNITKQSENIRDVNNLGDSIQFRITVENIGQLSMPGRTIKMELPNEIVPVKLTHGKTDNVSYMSQSSRSIEENIPELNPGESYIFELTALLDMDANYKEHYQTTYILATVGDDEIVWDVTVENPDFLEQYTDPTPTPRRTPWKQNPTPTPTSGGQVTITPTPTSGEQRTPTQTPIKTSEEQGRTNPTATPIKTSEGQGEINPVVQPETPKEEDPDEQPTGNYISGNVWIDENKDGVMQANESMEKGITVKLVLGNNAIKETKTSENGYYIFKNLENEEYRILFEFDENKYEVTEFRKTGQIEVNSSALSYSGNKGMALTETMKIEDNSISHINIGLIKILQFDLSLNKVVNKIIVQTKDDTKTYEPKSNFAKFDIREKNLKGSIVLIEYKIIVKNEGEIPATVRSIVDYIPKGMTFSTDLNKNWIQDSDGYLYNSELKNIKINPGESKAITLVLTKNMTDNNVGLISNTAELVEVQNSENINDRDSTVANKKKGEDDISTADVLIGVSTGNEILYVIITVISLIIIMTGFYIIKNKHILKGIK